MVASTLPPYEEKTVEREGHGIYVREFPGEGPPILLLHGFPDNHHLYDLLVPHLAPHRRVVTFDFSGWGNSAKPQDHPYTHDARTLDLDAVIAALELDEIVLVCHDASGPPAIDWAIAHPERIATLVLLNTYYNLMPELKSPEAIALFSNPRSRGIARTVSSLFDHLLFRKLYRWQVGRFIRDANTRDIFVPLLYEQFAAEPSTRGPFWMLCADLRPAVAARSELVHQLAAFDRPVRIIFGDQDPYLNAAVGRRFHEQFPTSDLHLIEGARHFVQIDEPERVAELILSAPAA